jgi:hypothetical protein
MNEFEAIDSEIKEANPEGSAGNLLKAAVYSDTLAIAVCYAAGAIAKGWLQEEEAGFFPSSGLAFSGGSGQARRLILRLTLGLLSIRKENAIENGRVILHQELFNKPRSGFVPIFDLDAFEFVRGDEPMEGVYADWKESGLGCMPNLIATVSEDPACKMPKNFLIVPLKKGIYDICRTPGIGQIVRELEQAADRSYYDWCGVKLYEQDVGLARRQSLVDCVRVSKSHHPAWSLILAGAKGLDGWTKYPVMERRILSLMRE